MSYEKYAAIRDRKGYKDADVADGADVAPATLSQWKAKKSKPKADKLLRIADFLGIPVDILIRE